MEIKKDSLEFLKDEKKNRRIRRQKIGQQRQQSQHMHKYILFMLCYLSVSVYITYAESSKWSIFFSYHFTLHDSIKTKKNETKQVNLSLHLKLFRALIKTIIKIIIKKKYQDDQVRRNWVKERNNKKK